MWTENKIFLNDLKDISSTSFIEWEKFFGKTIFITGATGLIGYTTTCALLYYNQKNTNAKIRIVALVRNIELAKKQYEAPLSEGLQFHFVEGDIEHLPTIDEPIHYIIHTASPTESSYFSSHPVETISAILNGTKQILHLAHSKQIQGMVYLSSMEIYGSIKTKTLLSEDHLGSIDILNPRSSYPQAKRLAETLCASFADEYRVPVCIARLSQTFGAGVKKNDSRVFAYMIHCVINNKNIELKTAGDKENMYCYTTDAVTAILLLLTKGVQGEAYNIANPNTYCSVKQMGELVLKTFQKTELSVVTHVESDTKSRNIFRPDGYLNLDTQKIQQLGWEPKISLSEMYRRTIQTLL